MLREKIHAALKDAAEYGDDRATATLRLVLAAVHERDVCLREQGVSDGVRDDDILSMLREMVRQRRRDINRCETCAHLDLAEKEAEEIRILEQFLPPAMNDEEINAAVDHAIENLGASKLKDTGRIISTLKERYNGQMDFAAAKRKICQKLH